MDICFLNPYYPPEIPSIKDEEAFFAANPSIGPSRRINLLFCALTFERKLCELGPYGRSHKSDRLASK
jgi:hypothetical protein